MILSMATVHISEAEAARDFPALLARVRAGEEIVIEKEAAPAVVLRAGRCAARRPLCCAPPLSPADACCRNP
jgi:antitoxin (DNA-binding transcriptional repressor) of toxin-antitoxin stability system